MLFHKYLNAIFAFLIAICFALCLVGCKSYEKTTQTSSQVKETTKLEYVSAPIKTDYKLGLECDSLGNVKPVSKMQSSGLNKAGVNIEGNQLHVELETGESRYINFQKKEKSKSSKTEKTKVYVTAAWHWWAHLVSLLAIAALLYFGSPVGFLNKIISKFVK